MGTGKETHEYR